MWNYVSESCHINSGHSLSRRIKCYTSSLKLLLSSLCRIPHSFLIASREQPEFTCSTARGRALHPFLSRRLRAL